jgi:hypothetical protein
MFSRFCSASASAFTKVAQSTLVLTSLAATGMSNAGVLLFDDFSSTKPDVYVRAAPIDAASSATTAGAPADYWATRTLRIVSTNGTENKTQAWIQGGVLDLANASGVSSRAGISWSSRSLPSGITGWSLTAELIALDTGTVTTAGSSVTRLTTSPFTTTLVTLGTGTALAAVNQEFYIDSGVATDFTLDNVRLSFTCRAINGTSSSAIEASIAAAGSDGCASVPAPASVLLFGLGGLAVFYKGCRITLQRAKRKGLK